MKEKAEELHDIGGKYEKAKAEADKIRGVEVDISHQLDEYAKVWKLIIGYVSDTWYNSSHRLNGE